MLTKKRTTLVFLSFLLISVAMIIAARHGSGQTNRAATGTRMKVLRRKDQLHSKPTVAEIASKQNKFEEGAPVAQKEERELEDQIPKHLPIKVKLRAEREKAFKDMKNKYWTREVEIEVKNTGTRPIYYLVLLLELPEVRVAEGHTLFDLRYGNKKFMNFAAGAQAGDSSLKPGETTVLKIPDKLMGWEDSPWARNSPEPKRFMLRFQELSFGDGTGFRRTDGVPWPEPDDRPALRCAPGLATTLTKANHAQVANKKVNSGIQKIWLGGEPAISLPARFFSPEVSGPSFLSPVEPTAEASSCCPGVRCQRVKEYESEDVCFDCGSAHQADPVSCTEVGGCAIVEIEYRTCHVVRHYPYEDDWDYYYQCGFAVTTTCLATPTPTPTPTPSPTPTPCQPLNCTDPYPAVPANPCVPEQNQPGTNCPLGFTQTGNCCYPACPLPTYPSPGCPSGQTEHWDQISCTWLCFVIPPGGGGGGGGGGGDPLGGSYYYQCNDYFWVLYEYDEVFGWTEVSSWYAGCF